MQNILFLTILLGVIEYIKSKENITVHFAIYSHLDPGW